MMKRFPVPMLVLGVVCLVAAGRAEEPADEDEPDAAPPVATELLSVTAERTRALAEDPGASPATRRGSQLVLRIRVPAEVRSLIQERAAVSIAGHFDDPAQTALTMNEQSRQRVLLEARPDGSSVLHLTCELPPSGATVIAGFALLAGRGSPSAGGEASSRRYALVEDIRERKGENLSPPGTKEEWYRVEGFGPKSISIRRLAEEAPPIAELRLTNVEDTLLEPIPYASKSIRDPSEGGWVAILVFEQHVPLVVNLLIPALSPPPEELLAVERVELP